MRPTLLGRVNTVTGTEIRVHLADSLSSGIAMIGGRSYRVGQVGSFIRVPQGYQDLFGIITQAGASASTEPAQDESSGRWVTVQLVGEIVDVAFERGISQYPNVGDEVHLVTEDDLARIYGARNGQGVPIGRLSSADSITVRLDLERLVLRHSAVLGSTGSGKSTTVASLLQSMCSRPGTHGKSGLPSARILVIDIHGEYADAFGSLAKVFRVNPQPDQERLHIPFWATDPDQLLQFLLGELNDKQCAAVSDRITQLKREYIRSHPASGLREDTITIETPIPFSLKRLWLELIDPEVRTWNDQQRTIPALVRQGDADSLLAPEYTPPGAGSSLPHANQQGVLGIRRQLDQFRSRLLDRQYDFLLRPGPWDPLPSGSTESDLPRLLESWLGHERPISVLDLSGIPSDVLSRLLGSVLRILFDGLFWGRLKGEGGIERPLLVVLEEAHRYLGKQHDSSARAIVQRIVKEGRKFGIGAMLVSQRPSEVDDTILSQCGTFFALRLTNSTDRASVQGTLPDGLASLVGSLPSLRTGEALITGEAAYLPMRCQVTLPPEDRRPSSGDPEVLKAWTRPRLPESYERLVSSWRAQDARWAAVRPKREAAPSSAGDTMQRSPVSSSNIASIGYDASTETLEVEFCSGGIYQYYAVPQDAYESLLSASSHGAHFHSHIKGRYQYARV